MTRKTEFTWASIAGADPEPVELIEVDGRKGVLTTGCGDPFWMDDDIAGVVLHASLLERPRPFETTEQRAERQRKYEEDLAKHRAAKVRMYGAGHAWRGPR